MFLYNNRLKIYWKFGGHIKIPFWKFDEKMDILKRASLYYTVIIKYQCYILLLYIDSKSIFNKTDKQEGLFSATIPVQYTSISICQNFTIIFTEEIHS